MDELRICQGSQYPRNHYEALTTSWDQNARVLTLVHQLRCGCPPPPFCRIRVLGVNCRYMSWAEGALGHRFRGLRLSGWGWDALWLS